MTIVKQCAGRYLKTLVESGVKIEYEDLVGELNLVYAEVMNYYDPEQGAKFGTFFAACARNRVLDLIRESKKTPVLFTNCQGKIDGCEAELPDLLDQIAIGQVVSKRATYRAQAVLDEMVSPSEDTMARADYYRHNDNQITWYPMHQAVGDSLGLTVDQVRYDIKNIGKIVDKALSDI